MRHNTQLEKCGCVTYATHTTGEILTLKRCNKHRAEHIAELRRLARQAIDGAISKVRKATHNGGVS